MKSYNAKVVRELEDIVARRCFNEQEFPSLRIKRRPYPIWYEDGRFEETRVSDRSKLPDADLINGYYKFGTGRVSIGVAIVEILNHLEQRYGLKIEE